MLVNYKIKIMVLLCFGTRPEWLKIKPLIKLMNRSEYRLLFTGQHTDLLRNIDVDYNINIPWRLPQLPQLFEQFPQVLPLGF